MTTTADVAAATGLTYRRLDHWTHQGYLRPDNPPPGQGYRRHWPDEEIAVARRMAALIGDGLTVEAAAKHARAGTPPPRGHRRPGSRVPVFVVARRRRAELRRTLAGRR